MLLDAVHPDVLAGVRDETSRLLSRLIQIDTSNPPGGETAVAEFMDAYFREAGLDGEIVGESPERQSYVLRLQGRRPGPSLLLLAHEDVVPADSAEWRVPPFSGAIEDGYVWGRGAVDIKNLVAANAVAVKRLAAAGAPFDGTVVYACTADEEVGTHAGARWLVEHRPDLVRCDYVLNEGDGGVLVRGGRRMLLLESGEKGIARFRLVVRGQAGHASVPLRGGNAVVGAARVIEALVTHDLPLIVDETSHAIVARLVGDASLRDRLRDAKTARGALEELADRDPTVADILEPLYGFAFSPTTLLANSRAVNVFSSRVEVGVDCRTMPGQGPDDVEEEVQRALHGVDADWALEWTHLVSGNASPYPSRLSEAIDAVIGRLAPGVEAIPSFGVGFTDSNWFRERFPETVAYNFLPHLVESYEDVTPRYHNKDERIDARDLAFQAIFAERLALELLRDE